MQQAQCGERGEEPSLAKVKLFQYVFEGKKSKLKTLLKTGMLQYTFIISRILII